MPLSALEQARPQLTTQEHAPSISKQEARDRVARRDERADQSGPIRALETARSGEKEDVSVLGFTSTRC